MTRAFSESVVHDLTAQPGQCRSGIFFVAFQQLDGDALRPANETDAHTGPDGERLFCEFNTLGLDLGGHGIDVLYRETEMIEPLMRRYGRRMAAITFLAR